jgi:uroporphyrinogen decarboxylase
VDSRQRVEAALALERPDHVPVGAWGHAYRDEWSADRLADATIGRAKRFGWDFIKFQPRATCFAEAFGAEYRPSGNALDGPVLVRQVVSQLSDWAHLRRPDVNVSALGDQVDALGIVVSELGNRVPVIQTVFSPLTVAGYLAGKDQSRVVRDLIDHPDVVGPALATIAETLVQFAAASIGAGAAGVFYAISGYASREVMSRNEYEELALPYDIAVLSALPHRAWFNVLHLCGGAIHFELSRLLNVQAISWDVHADGNPSLKQGRAIADRAVMGGLAHKSTLVAGTPEDVTREADRVLSETDGRGLLLAPGCSVPPEAPEENLVAMARPLAVGG